MKKPIAIDGDLYDCMLILAEEEGGVLDGADFVEYGDLYLETNRRPCCVFGVARAVTADLGDIDQHGLLCDQGAGLLAGLGRLMSDQAIRAEQRARGLVVAIDRVPLEAVFRRLRVVRGPESADA